MNKYIRDIKPISVKELEKRIESDPILKKCFEFSSSYFFENLVKDGFEVVLKNEQHYNS
jgi:hypothetical protein